MNCLDYFFSDFVVEINTKSSRINRICVKKINPIYRIEDD